MELKSLVLDSKSAWVDFPGLSGFSVEVVNLSRKELGKLRKRCLSQKFDRKTRQIAESLDEDKFVKEFAAATLRNWKGLTFEHLESLLLVDVSDKNPQDELAYTPDNAEVLVAQSTEFDTWLNEVVFDLDNFRDKSKIGAVEEA